MKLWLEHGFLPDDLESYAPHGSDLPASYCMTQEQRGLYHSLVDWCAIQSWWYYIASSPVASDREFDFIKREIKLIEDTNRPFSWCFDYTSAANPCGYSPTLFGHNRLGPIWSRYPQKIIAAFAGRVRMNPRFSFTLPESPKPLECFQRKQVLFFK